MSEQGYLLPETWVEASLGQVIQYGATEKAEPNTISNETWVLELEDIEKETSKILSRKTFAERKSKSTKNRFGVGDVLYGKLRPYLNKIIIADDSGVCTTEILPLKPSGAVHGNFLFYWLKHPIFLDYVKAVSYGVNMPRLGTADGKAAPFFLAPLAEQKRIADKLDIVLTRVDACRERLDRVPLILKRFRQSVLVAATSGQLTVDWREKNIVTSHLTGEPIREARDELSEYLSDRSATEKKVPTKPDLRYWNFQVPTTWIICSVNQFAECLDRFRVPIKREDRSSGRGLFPYYGANGEVSRIDDFIFDDELVLVTEDETFYGREKPIAYRASGKCWVNNHAHVLRPITKDAADYLCYALMYYDVIPWLSGTTGRAKLTQAALNALPIAMPPKLEQAEIVRRVEILFAFADRLEARLANARAATDRLTPALLAKAFRGELIPQDPNDEPASELLKRLAAQREAAPKTARGRKATAL